MGPRISIILPCYNEGEHLPYSLERIQDFVAHFYKPEEFEIILIDDGSTDETRPMLGKYRSAPFRIYFNQRNLGRGGTVKRGVELSRGEIVGFMDIDCEVSEIYLTKFISVIEQGGDFAIGQRIYKVAPNPYVILRHVLSLIYKFFLRKITSCPIADTEVGFKFFSKRLAQAIQRESRFDGWFWDTECALLACSWGCKIQEIPVAFLRNPRKSSTVKILRDSLCYIKDFRKYLELKRRGAYASSIPLESNSQAERVAN